MHRSTSLTPPLNQPAHQAIIISFSELSQIKKPSPPCIFCGTTQMVDKFKGKTVCVHCLHQIPSIFSCG